MNVKMGDWVLPWFKYRRPKRNLELFLNTEITEISRRKKSCYFKG